MSLLSLIVYIPLQILFIPLAVLGAVYVGYRQLVISKKLGISQTAIEVLNGRWTMHIFGIRTDKACDKLAKVLSNTSVNGLWLALAPLWLKFKMSGELFLYPRIPEQGDEGLRDLMVSRTLYFDRVIERVIGDVEQFVFMGAGYDTRAYGDLATKGVTLYLSEADVRKTMRDVCSNAPAGSVLLADIYADSFVKNIGGRSGIKETLNYTNEGLAFSLPLATDYRKTLTDFVESESMSVGETFFMGCNSDKGPFMAVVEMQH